MNHDVEEAFYTILKPVLGKMIREHVSPANLPTYVRQFIRAVYSDGELAEYTQAMSDGQAILDYTRLPRAAFDVVSQNYSGLWWVYRLSAQNEQRNKVSPGHHNGQEAGFQSLLAGKDQILVNRMLLRVLPQFAGHGPRFNLYGHSSTTPTRTPAKTTGTVVFVSGRHYFYGHNDLGEGQPATHAVLMIWQHVGEDSGSRVPAHPGATFRSGSICLRNSSNQQISGYVHASRITGTEAIDEAAVEAKKDELKEQVRLCTLGEVLADAPPEEQTLHCAMVTNSVTDAVFYVGGNR